MPKDSLPWTELEWSEWLLKAMRAYYIEGGGRFAFRPFHSVFDYDWSIGQDIENLAHDLDACQREFLLKAIAAAVTQLDIVNDNKAIDTLVYVACRFQIGGVHDTLFEKMNTAISTGQVHIVSEKHMEWLEHTAVFEIGTSRWVPIRCYVAARLMSQCVDM